MDILGFDSYLVKVDGSGRLTKRNRRFLRKFVPASPCLSSPPRYTSPVPSTTTNPHHQTVVSDIVRNPEQQPTAVPSATFDDTNSDAHHSTPQPGLEDQDATYSTPAIQDSTTPVSVEPPSCRTRRAVSAPRRYEPETGKWVSQ